MKIVHRLFFAFLGVCGVHGIAAAERWTVVGQTEKVVVHVDADSIAVKDGFRRAWEKWEYSEDRSPPPLTSVHKPFRTARYLTSYDCKARTSAELQAIFYDVNGETVGKIIAEPKSVTFSYMVPGLLGDSALDFACSAKLRAPRR